MISNVDAQPHSDPAVIKDILARQVSNMEAGETFAYSQMMQSPLCLQQKNIWCCLFSMAIFYLCGSMQLTSPVLWQKTLETLLDKGLERSYEIGPNKVISGIMKRISKEHSITNVSA